MLWRSKWRLYSSIALVAVSGLAWGCCDECETPIEADVTESPCEGVQCATGEICNGATGECVALDSSPCAEVVCEVGEVCDGQTGECVAIEDSLCADSDCTPEQVCDGATGECIDIPVPECTADADCAPGCESCVDGACEAIPGACCTNADCPSSAPVCSEASVCTNCEVDPFSQQCVTLCEGEGTPCDDGNFCTVSDTCTDGVCRGSVRDCSVAGGPCSIGVCNDDSDACEPLSIPDGTPCSDGEGACLDGACGLAACGPDDPQGACPLGWSCGVVDDVSACVPAQCGDSSWADQCAGGSCPTGQVCDPDSCTCASDSSDLPSPEVSLFVASDVVCSGTRVLLSATLDPAHSDTSTIDGVTFEVSTDGGESFTLVGTGDVRGLTVGIWEQFWDVSDADLGAAFVRVTVTDVAGQTANAVAPLIVNASPEAVLEIAYAEFGEELVAVGLDASGSSDSDGKVVGYSWDLGDGALGEPGPDPFTETTFPTISELPPIISLRVTDNVGCTAMVIRDVIVEPKEETVELIETHDCGCKEMTVRVNPAGGPTGFYCAPLGLPAAIGLPPACVQIPVFGGLFGCAPGTAPTFCPTGPYTAPTAGGGLFLGWSFEVDASLTPNTNDPAACHEGQYAAATMRLDGAPVALPIPPPLPPAPGIIVDPFPLLAVLAYPPFGSFALFPPPLGLLPMYGPDDYAAPFAFKQHGAARIRWYDAPGFVVPAVPPPHTGAVFAEFVPFLTGTGERPSCYCRFRIAYGVIRLPLIGDFAINAAPVLVDGSNCTLL